LAVGDEENGDPLAVQLVMVRCMECEAKNNISVIKADRSVAGSCHKCSAKMQGKIIQIVLK
jgi:hypothetical protein